MAKRTAHVPLELDMRGVSLAGFAQAICLQEQLEVSLVRLHITVQQLTFPLCLVAASGLRPQVRPRLGDIPASLYIPFFRLLLGDPRQSPGGVAGNLREHWYMTLS